MKKKKTKIVTVDRYHKYADIDEMYSTKQRDIKLLIPSNLRMLCAILEVKVEDLLYDFMWMLSYSAIEGATNKQRKAAKKFFLLCRYGQPQYSEKQIKQMFDELKAGRKIYDTIDGMEQDDMELFWRNNHMYWQHWFKRWFKKNTRQDDISVLEKY
jgi:DNA-binding Xre family transcriptional regulator